MSYDIELRDSLGCTMRLNAPHQLKGGTFVLGGTTNCKLNVTYNYAEHYYRVMGEKGIRTIYGMTAAASVPVLEAAIDALGDDVSENYWESTEGNAKQALLHLLALAKLGPDGVWTGD